MKGILEDRGIRFIVGMVMLITGLWLFIQKVYVASNFFSSGVKIGGVYLRSGILALPLIAGLVWMFFKPSSKLPKIVSILGVVLIVVYALATVNIRVSHIPVLRWVAMLFLIVVGAILTVSSIAGKKDTWR